MFGRKSETRDVSQFPTAARQTYRLKPTLVSILIGLLVATVTSVGILVYLKTDELLETLVDQQFSTVVFGTVARTQQLMDGAPAILREYEVLAERGLLPLDDNDALAVMFAERLRQHPEIVSIGFADDRDGSYVGAHRRNETDIILFSADPKVGGDVPVEIKIDRSGRRTPVAPSETGPFRVREKLWFTAARDGDDIRWLNPSEFVEGRHGAVAAVPLRRPGTGDFIGVLQTDIEVEDIIEFLDSEVIGREGRVHLLARNGAVIAMASAWAGGDPALDSAIRALPGVLDRLTSDGRETLEFAHAGEEWAVSFTRIGLADGPDWVVSVLAPDSEFHGPAKRIAVLTVNVGLATLFLAALLSALIANRISVPLRLISDDLERVAAFSFDHTPPPRTFIHEVIVVGRTVARMKSSLRAFARYVPDVVVRDLLTSGREAELGGERRRLTIHFSDIAGYTSIAETLPPEQMVEELGDYFTLMRGAVHDHRGTLDKYMGDGILAFFNAPLPVADHETRACMAALDAQARLAQDRERREAAGRPQFHALIGLAVGEVIVGNIGTPERFAYTVIGDAVNLASRLEGLNKFYGTTIIASSELMAATGDAFEWRRIDRVAVFGRSASTDVCELLGRKGEVPDAVLAARDAYEAALDDYLAGRFVEAAARFAELWRDSPGTTTVEIMARRSRKLARRRPDADWDGIYVHAQK
jgi:adenylate cyclase